MAGEERWIVTLNPDRPHDVVQAGLAATGFKVDELLEAIGVVVGRADDHVVRKVRVLDGVEDVSRELAVDVGPPDEPETW